MTRSAHVGYSLTDNSNPDNPNERIFKQRDHFSVPIMYSELHDVNKSRESRVFVELPMVESHIDVWVDMFLMLYVVKKYCGGISEPIKIDVDIDKGYLHLYYDRYTMNPSGFHIGYETWQASFPIRRKRSNELNSMILHSLDIERIDGMDIEWFEYVVLLDDMTVECIRAPETETCDCGEEDDCQCESYISPMDDESMDDFGYQEFDSTVVDVVKNTQACWVFGDGRWSMYVDHQFVWEAKEE